MTLHVPGPQDTIEHSQKWLEENRRDGVDCPSCGEIVKVYRHNIDSAMARTLILMYAKGGTEYFVHTPSLPGDTHKASQLKWWGFVEEERVLREDGGRAGYWRVTPAGEEWINGGVIAKHALVFNGRCLELLDEKKVTITEALGKKFNFRELMEG